MSVAAVTLSRSDEVNHPRSLVAIETHPIQYHAPVYRCLQQKLAIPVTSIYASDFSVVGYRDQEFGHTFAWDTDLLSGYTSVFLSKVAEGGARSAEGVSARGLGTALRQARASAILLTGYSPRFHQQAFYHAWRSGLPILFRGETTDHAQSRTRIRAWARRHALQSVYWRCRRLLYVGKRSGQHFRTLGCEEEKLVSAPYCVDTEAFQCGEVARACQRQEMRRQLEIEAGEVVLVFSGKFSLRKGADLLVKAVRALEFDLRTRTTIVFLGSGELEGMLMSLAATDPEVRVRFVGFQNQSRLSPYYHAADIVVLPSVQGETWGLVVNEALHHGIPCVVSDAVGCAPDLIEPGMTGEIARAGSVEDLTAALRRAFTLTERTEIRDNCRRVVGGYTVDKAAEGIAQAFSAAVN